MKTNNATNGIERQDHLANLLLVLFYIAGALVAGMLCFANGDAGAALGVLALFVLHALVITLGAPQADPQLPCIEIPHEIHIRLPTRNEFPAALR